MLSPYTVTIYTKQDNPYNVIPDAPIEIRERLANGTSGSLSIIYSDQEGLIPITQTGAKADSNGQFVFYAEAAQYNAVYESQTVPVDVGLTVDTLPSAMINNLSLPYVFDTVDEYRQFTGVFPIGKVIKLLDRAAEFRVIDGTNTANDKNIVASNSTGQSISLILPNGNPISWGAVGGSGAVDDSPVFRAMAAALVRSIELGPHLYGMAGGVEFERGTEFYGTSSEFISGFIALENFDTVTYETMLRFKSSNPWATGAGLNIRHFVCKMNGVDVHAVEILKTYDNCFVSDLNLQAIGPNSSALRIVPDPDFYNGNEVSQSITLQNITGIHKDGTATAPTFYFNHCQEMTMTAVKAFGGPFASIPDCRTMEFYNCRGVQLFGCSSAITKGAAILVTTDTDGVTDGPNVRSTSYISIFAHTFEEINDDDSGKSYGLLAIGSPNANLEAIGINLIQPRWQLNFGANFVGAKYMNVIRGHVDAIGQLVDFGGAIECKAVVSRYEHIIDSNSNANSVEVIASTGSRTTTFAGNMTVKSDAIPRMIWELPEVSTVTPGAYAAWIARWNGSGSVDNGWQLVGPHGDVCITAQNPIAGSPRLGFFGSVGQVKLPVSGSRGGNSALAMLLTRLEQYGLIDDNSSA